MTKPTTAVWREQAIAEIAQCRITLAWLTSSARNGQRVDPKALAKIAESLDLAAKAAVDEGLSRWTRVASSIRGASLERTWSQIDAAREALLRIAPDDYVIGQIPRITSRAERMLSCDDARRAGLRRVAQKYAAKGAPDTVGPADREILLGGFHAANCEARRKHSRVRSFRNMLLLCGLVLTIAAIGLAALGYARPGLALLCFQPSGQAVCPTKVVATDDAAPTTGQPATTVTPQQVEDADRATRAAASPGDVLLVEVIGLIAAALAAATALRRIHGTSTPYGVPFAVAVLKLPSGALTAAFGLLLMRADFVPGLSALDTPAQIIGWAIIFGYAQQLFTRFVDARAQTVLSGAAGETATPPPARPLEPAAQIA
jgi:hypothetical protein